MPDDLPTGSDGASLQARAVALSEWIQAVALEQLRCGPHATDRSRRVGGDLDLYGLCDAVVVMATAGRLPPYPQERAGWVHAVQSFQDPASGWFVEHSEPTHVEWHATAYAVAALQLLDARPRHAIGAALQLVEPSALRRRLGELDWGDWVYLESHTGAGIGTVFTILEDLLTSPEDRARWFDSYFDVLDAHLDPRSGLHGDRKPRTGDLDQLGGTFHYAFLYEHHRRPLPFALERAASVERLQQPSGLWDPANPWWLTLDGTYLLRTAADEAPEATERARHGISRAVSTVLDRWRPEARDRLIRTSPMASHDLAALVTLLAEAGAALGWTWQGGRRLISVLSHRPFI
jgi:hypothetical protein